jgi:predicted DNA-binding protein
MAKANDRPLTVRIPIEEYELLSEIATDLGKDPAAVARECIQSYLHHSEPAKAIYRLKKPKRSHAKQLTAA